MVGEDPLRAASIHRLTDPTCLAALAVEADVDGHRMVSRLVREWYAGENRFVLPGEQAFVATRQGIAVGVCGLNVDPFVGGVVGRVRRLYVARAARRQRVGAALGEGVLAEAAGCFHCLHVRTFDPAAAAFYESVGFDRITGDPCCTHRRLVPK